MICKTKVNNIIKIVGRSYAPLEDRPVYLVLKKKESNYKYDLLLLNEDGETFWTSFNKRSKKGNVIIL